LRELITFGIKQAQACLFGGLLLAAILGTHLWYPWEATLHRYDFLFLYAVALQVMLLALRLESPREAVVILLFHVLATVMELFKTSSTIASWRYPGEFEIGIGNVPLFAGFMYSAVGSYIARIWRIFDFRFTHYPPRALTVALAFLIYGNFFTHHFVPDLRWWLFGAVVLLYGRVWIHFRVRDHHRRMPLLLGWLLVALFIWIAENTATFGAIWVYPSQEDGWQVVPLTKLGSWFLLMILSFVLVSLVHGTVEE
jgi:uncharacterized membrane protein YoaT (DUF817 family)